MPLRSTDALFGLIQSLTKAEKRNFKLYVGRNTTGPGTLKTTALFDQLDKMDEYDEATILRKNATIKKEQLPNLKAQLYRQILASLRTLRDDRHVEAVLHEQLENATILYDRGLYRQALRMLERVKDLARNHHQNTFLLQALVFEKKIESLHITRSIANRADALAEEVRELNRRLALIGLLSNLSLQLYGWYINIGHARNARDVQAVREFFHAQLPAEVPTQDNFFGRLYLAQAHCWHNFIAQDFLAYYRNAQRWVDLFNAEPQMIRVETPYYIKGMHNLLLAHFMLRNKVKYEPVLQELTDFAESSAALANPNLAAQTFIYLYQARINFCFMSGDFEAGLRLVPAIEEGLKQYEAQIDRHRALVFDYKIACLYFGHGQPDRAIDYLQQIIQQKTDLRSDLQCYTRFLHLICHYELGNFMLLEHLIKSVYRYMLNMENLSAVEEEVFRFLRRAFMLRGAEQIRTALINLRSRLEKLAENPYERRSFMYLDIISWLDSRISGRPLSDIMREK
jgi:hypothetical protein